MEERQSKKNIRAIDIVQVSFMAAMAFVVTYLVEIPVGTKAVLHLGDTIVFAGAILLGKKKAAFAAAIGMGMFDIYSSYAVWAPFTFVIKGMMAYIAASIAYRNGYNGDKMLNNIMGFIIAGLWMILGYFIAGGLIYSNFAFSFGDKLGNIIQLLIHQFKLGLLVATGDIPGNILQVVGGIVVALPLIKALEEHKVIRK